MRPFFTMRLPVDIAFYCSSLSQNMSLLRVVAKQINRQCTLQPRLGLPAGRIVSLEEGRRLAKLVNDEEERVTSGASMLLDNGAAETPVVLEESVSKRILLLRQKQNKEANIKAAVAYARRQKQNNRFPAADGEKVQTIAQKVFKGSRSDVSSALRQRRLRGSGSKNRSAKKASK